MFLMEACMLLAHSPCFCRLCQLMGAEGVVGIVSIHILEHTRLRSLSEGKADM